MKGMDEFLPEKSDFSLEEIELQVKSGSKVFIDSETCGLHSIMVLWQFQIDSGPIYLHNVWKKPVWFTKRLFEMLMELDYIGFNLVFDHFHLSKIYTIWNLLPEDWIPEEHIEEIALQYEAAGQDGPFIKPKRALDLLLYSRKNELQTLMARGDIRIRQVPTALAYALAKELESRIKIDGIYFAKAKDPNAPRWKVFDRQKDGEFDPNFKDVVLKFKPAGGLKFLAEHVLKLEPRFHYDDVEVPRSQIPPDAKLGYMPTALGMAPGGSDDDWRIYDRNGKCKGHAWPYWLKIHIDHWAQNVNAREYAYYDIVYTHTLYDHFKQPEMGDDDSELACMVGCVRWHGFEIEKEGMQKLLIKGKKLLTKSPVNLHKPKEIRRYIQDAMDDIEGIIIDESTKKQVLVSISKMVVEESEHESQCTKCEGNGCPRCFGKGIMDANREIIYDDIGAIKVGNHAAAIRADEVLQLKRVSKELENYEKLLRAGKFHPDFSVIGTLSTRMSGAGGLNAQGIKHTKEVRRLFPLKWKDMILSGGDFDSYEVVLAATVYDDPDLNRALTEKINCKACKHGSVCPKCDGSGKTEFGQCKFCDTGSYICPSCKGKGWYRRKIHALFGMAMYPGASYEDVMASDGTQHDMYTQGKSGVFGMIFGGDWNTLVKNFSLDDKVAQEAEERFFKMFPGIRKARQRIVKMFQSMIQIDGAQVIWKEPAPYIESFLGFRRYFTLENDICRALYNMAKHPPNYWLTKKFKNIKVVRRLKKGVQTAAGAAMSALYGAAFGIQSQNTRAAANHEIQSPGGQICKHVQRRIWDLQPHGVHPIRVAPINVHDEILCVNNCPDEIGAVVKESVESYRDRIPLLGMTWNIEQENWADKKGGTVTLAITPPELL